MKSYPLYCVTHEPLEQISKSFRFPWLRANIDDEVDYDDENAFHNMYCILTNFCPVTILGSDLDLFP